MGGVSGHQLGGFEQLVLLTVIGSEEEAWTEVVQRLIEKKRGATISKSVVHKTLKRLVDKGYLSMQLAAKTGQRGRRRLVFAATDRGAERVQELRDALDEVDCVHVGGTISDKRLEMSKPGSGDSTTSAPFHVAIPPRAGAAIAQEN